MTLRHVLFLAVVAVVGARGAARAELEHVAMGKDTLPIEAGIEFRAVAQENPDLDASLRDPRSDWMQATLRLAARLDFTKNRELVVRVLHEGDWTGRDETDLDDDPALDLAYASWDEAFGRNVLVRVGRQEWQIGRGFVFGDGDPRRTASYQWNTRRSFDAARVRFDFAEEGPLVLDTGVAWFSGGYDRYEKPIYVAALKWQEQASEVELAAFHLDDDPGRVEAISLRGEQEVVERVRVLAEAVVQAGESLDQVDRQGFGAWAGVDWNVPEIQSDLSARYFYLSGDDPATPGTDESFHPMAENMRYGELWEAFNLRNNVYISCIGFVTHVTETFAVGFDYFTYQFDDPMQWASRPGKEFDLTFRYFPADLWEVALMGGIFDPSASFGKSYFRQVMGTAARSF